MMSTLVLASQSPRRKSLLTQLGYVFSCYPANIDESVKTGETPAQYVARLAKEKAQAAASQFDSQHIVIGSDTSVVYQQHIFGKPVNFADFEAMMNMLSAKTHQVMTAIAVVGNNSVEAAVITTDVSFKQLSSEEIKEYWQTGEPQDKAGGYGIQGIGGKFVTNINGSYSAVVGLPLFETDQLLKRFNLVPKFELNTQE